MLTLRSILPGSLALMILPWCGCHSLGPQDITGSHALYSQAVIDSLDRQLLHNLVRLRYRDNPYFLQIDSITASLKLQASLGIDTELSLGPSDDLLQPNAGLLYSTSPTISYVPLHGEDFLKNVLSPVSLESIFVLIQSGWSAKRVFGICVERINNLDNAAKASGPTPSQPPTNQDGFRQLLDNLEQLRADEHMYSSIDPETGAMMLRLSPDSTDNPIAQEVKGLLNLDPDRNWFAIQGSYRDASDQTITIRTRSIMSILFYLSQNIATPAAHQEKGLVTITTNPDQSPFDWSQTAAGSLFRVHSSAHTPKDAFLAIPYRGHWFYVADNDLESKSTFLLLSQLFSLQAGNIESAGPTLTIPVSQ